MSTNSIVLAPLGILLMLVEVSVHCADKTKENTPPAWNSGLPNSLGKQDKTERFPGWHKLKHS